MANSLSVENLSPLIQKRQTQTQQGEVNGQAFEQSLQQEFKSIDSDKGIQGISGMISESIQHVNQQQQHADAAIQEFVAGKTQNPHETLLAVERADASLKMFMQVRNKVLDAYRQIMKMRV